MESAEIMEIAHEAMMVLIITAAPAMLTALIVGLIISLIQALTQIQEATLTFVPKILAMFLVISLTMPFVLRMLIDYTGRLQEKIIHIQ